MYLPVRALFVKVLSEKRSKIDAVSLKMPKGAGKRQN